jgi:hypothetical protein
MDKLNKTFSSGPAWSLVSWKMMTLRGTWIAARSHMATTPCSFSHGLCHDWCMILRIRSSKRVVSDILVIWAVFHIIILNYFILSRLIEKMTHMTHIHLLMRIIRGYWIRDFLLSQSKRNIHVMGTPSTLRVDTSPITKFQMRMIWLFHSALISQEFSHDVFLYNVINS